MGLAVTYRQRHPERTPFYQCLEDYWEEFKESYRYFYERDSGSLRPVGGKTVDRFSECRIFRHGFARIRCPECREECLLAFSCKTRYFCPSCQARRVAAFVEWITGEILQEVPHRQLVWTIPKVLRPTFRRDRKLLGELSRAAWRSLSQYFGHALGCDSVPAAIFAIQTATSSTGIPICIAFWPTGPGVKETGPSNPSPGSPRTFSAPLSANRSWP